MLKTDARELLCNGQGRQVTEVPWSEVLLHVSMDSWQSEYLSRGGCHCHCLGCWLLGAAISRALPAAPGRAGLGWLVAVACACLGMYLPYLRIPGLLGA